MKKKMFVWVMLILPILSILTPAFNIQPVKAEPSAETVPDDYPTIQKAINAANPGGEEK